MSSRDKSQTMEYRSWDALRSGWVEVMKLSLTVGFVMT